MKAKELREQFGRNLGVALRMAYHHYDMDKCNMDDVVTIELVVLSDRKTYTPDQIYRNHRKLILRAEVEVKGDSIETKLNEVTFFHNKYSLLVDPEITDSINDANQEFTYDIIKGVNDTEKIDTNAFKESKKVIGNLTNDVDTLEKVIQSIVIANNDDVYEKLAKRSEGVGVFTEGVVNSRKVIKNLEFEIHI